MSAVVLLQDNREQVWRGDPSTDFDFIHDIAARSDASAVWYLYAIGKNNQRLPDPYSFRATPSSHSPWSSDDDQAEPAAAGSGVAPPWMADPAMAWERQAVREEKADQRQHTAQMAEIDAQRTTSMMDLAVQMNTAHTGQVNSLLTARAQDLSQFQASLSAQAEQMGQLRRDMVADTQRILEQQTSRLERMTTEHLAREREAMQRALEAERRADQMQIASIQANNDHAIALLRMELEHGSAIAAVRARSVPTSVHEDPAVRAAQAQLEIAKVTSKMRELDGGVAEDDGLLGSTLGVIAERMADIIEERGLEAVLGGRRRGGPGDEPPANRRDVADEEITE